MGRDSSTSLAPGFRFHPTDEELVRYYLRRKVSGKPFRFDPISEVDIYKIEPWDLPGMAKLKTRDLEWYFFSGLDKKYGNGSRTNRATEKGYWKTTGKDRPVSHNLRIVGMKKTLVFHRGRAPKGERSNWVMHEYRLADEELEKAGIAQDAFVLCRIFQKSGSGPKNGEHYGAPFVEEEWEDDEVAFVPGQEVPPDEFVYDDADGHDVYAEVNDIDQNLEAGFSSDNAPQPLKFYHGETSNYVENSEDYFKYDQKPVIGNGEIQRRSELRDDTKFVDLPEQYIKSVKEEYFVESNDNVDSVDVDYLLDEPYLDTSDNNLTSIGGLFLETNDLSNPIVSDPAGFGMLDDCLAYFDASDDKMTSDPSQLTENENFAIDQAALNQTDGISVGEPESSGSQHLAEAHVHNDASSSSMQNPESPKFESDIKYPFIKRASQMLGSMPAHPAFASEFPSKDASLRFNQAGQASSSVHVTAGMIQIRNVTLTGYGMDWSVGKNVNLNITVSFDLQGDVSPASLMPISSIFSGKTGSTLVPRGCLYLMFIWLLILLSVSFKIGSYIYTR